MTGSAGTQRTGQCLCGAVRFRASLKNHSLGVCHCSMCRRATAGPFFTVDCDTSVEVEDETHLASYQSSAWGERRFCARCGTPLFWRMRDGSMDVVSAFALDDLSGMRFDHQVFIDEKPDFYSFAEETRTLTGAQIMDMVAAGPDPTQHPVQSSDQSPTEPPARD